MKIRLSILIIFLPIILVSSDFSTFISQSQLRDWRTGEKTNVEFGFDFDIDEEFFIDSTFVFKLTNDSEYSLYYDRSDDLEIYFPTKNNIYLEGKLIYPFGWILDPYVSASGQTQITDMFKYHGERRVATAKFWDPITSIQSSGFTFKVLLDSINSTVFNLATTLRQIRSENYPLLADDKKTRDVIENYKSEIGLTVSNEFNVKLDDKNSVLKSKVVVFSKYEDLEKWAYQQQIELQTKFLGICVFSFKLGLNYDEDVSKQLNYNQSMQLGINLALFKD
ncbi:MAG: hypothetical protein R2863_07265 [Candidatus Kapaibacterium sp.]|nr:hypothetical protein [Ignavibacteriota bacterium]MCB9220622.1 hypothetical protein [Ignavibacteria bacterium]